MSRLNIADLSFCETEIDSSEKVKGGTRTSSMRYFSPFYGNFSFPIKKQDFKLVEQSLKRDGYKTSYYYDDATGNFALVASKNYGNRKTSRVTKSYVSKGNKASLNAFASV